MPVTMKPPGEGGTATIHVLHPAKPPADTLGGFGSGDCVVVTRDMHPHKDRTATVSGIDWKNRRVRVPIDGITFAFEPGDLQKARSGAAATGKEGEPHA